MKVLFFSKYSICLLLTFSMLDLSAETYAPWLTQIGLTEEVASAAKWGRGVKLGVVDTGIYANSPFFTKGQVSKTLSSCAALSFACSKNYHDDHGHGTAVAAIAAGSYLFPWESNYGGYAVSAKNIVSVAPSANIIAQKVLNSSGSGYSTDVANGIIKAANAGASVINVSITYANTADIVSSINYAASKGAYIVWAGGNSAANLLQNADTYGLSDAALNHLIFAGSVDANNHLSSFSNTPGNGKLNGTSSNLSYAQRWVMAPGENILSAYNPSEPYAWGYWSGTSMSAPLVSGSLVLLQSAWPILRTQGTAIDLLLSTTTDLGDEGVDSTYGYGLVNLEKAFEPYGELSVKNSKNTVSYLVSELNGSMITSGALGKLSKIKTKLSNYTAFDEYQRNFKVNLSGLIQSTATTASLNPLPMTSRKKAVAMKLHDGSTFVARTELPLNAFDHLGEFGFNPEHPQNNQPIYLAMNTVDGTSFAVANGFASQYAYAKALYADDNLAQLSSELSTQSLTPLAEGGKMINYGTTLSPNSRLAVSWSNPNASGNDMNGTIPDTQTNLFKLGLSYQFSPKLFAGITTNYLSEKNGLIGSRMTNAHTLGFNPNNKSFGLDFSFGYQPNENQIFLIEKGFSSTKSAPGAGFLINNTSGIASQSFGISSLSKNVLFNDDVLKISVKQPLAVTSGKAHINTVDVDDMGYPVYKNEAVDISPSGRETRLSFAYEKNFSQDESLKLETNFVRDAFNTDGNNDVSITLLYELHY